MGEIVYLQLNFIPTPVSLLVLLETVNQGKLMSIYGIEMNVLNPETEKGQDQIVLQRESQK